MTDVDVSPRGADWAVEAHAETAGGGYCFDSSAEQTATIAPAAQLLTNRTKHTRWLVTLLVPLFVFASPPNREAWTHSIFDVLGIFCLVICLVGRVWSSMYIAGRKNADLVQTGPYSAVRNPLYGVSFIGLCGIGLLSEMLTVLFVSAAVFGIYYRSVVQREERLLAYYFPIDFANYSARVPRWIPKLGKGRDTSMLEINPRQVFNHLKDSSLFFLSFLFFEMLDLLRAVGFIKPLFRLP